MDTTKEVTPQPELNTVEEGDRTPGIGPINFEAYANELLPGVMGRNARDLVAHLIKQYVKYAPQEEVSENGKKRPRRPC